MSNTITYKQAGVDTKKSEALMDNFRTWIASRPQDPAFTSGMSAFAGCYSLKSVLNKFEDPLLVNCCDGVGTKLLLALEWDRLEGVGFDLVAMSINDLLCCGATPLTFLDYYACGKLSQAHHQAVLKSIQLACEAAECSLVGGETAEMPGLYHNEDFDLAGFATGVVDRKKVLGKEKVQPGDRLVALPSSGLHSNGYSLVRKIVEREQLDPNSAPHFSDKSWKEILLAPTRIYTKSIKDALDKIHALAHITGGGLYENLPRIIPDGLVAQIEASQWNFPPLFHWLGQKAGLSERQLLETFNCGVGLIAACPKENLETLRPTLKEPFWEIGAIQKQAHPKSEKVLWQ